MCLEMATLTTIKAYILCKVSSGTERKVCKMIVEYPFVAAVNIIYGEYDLVAKIQVENLQQLNFIIDKIRMIPGITFTSTVLVGKEFKEHGKLVEPEDLQTKSIGSEN